jgi:FAD:protein FMN transferase
MQTSPSHTSSRMRIALGTFVVIEARAPSRPAADDGIAAAFAAIAEVDRLMHPSRPGSDLAVLARAPRGIALAMHPWTWEVLDLSRRLCEWSCGAFDPCLDSAMGRLEDIDLSRPGYAVPHAPVHVDLGGIAKGFAVDRAIDALRASGCDGGLVNAGGDLAAFGDRRHPIVRLNPDGSSCIVELKDAALAASDTERSARPMEHRGYYHGADRRRRVSGSATVMARSAAVADALTKCALAGGCGFERGLLEACGARVLQLAPRPERVRGISERQAQPQIEAGEVLVEVEPLIVGFENQVRRHVEIGTHGPHPVPVDGPVSVIAGICRNRNEPGR